MIFKVLRFLILRKEKDIVHIKRKTKKVFQSKTVFILQDQNMFFDMDNISFLLVLVACLIQVLH